MRPAWPGEGGKHLKFGDVVRVDPVLSPRVPQPDDRRWMVLSFDDRLKWTLLFIGPFASPSGGGLVSHWPSLTGFVRVDE